MKEHKRLICPFCGGQLETMHNKKMLGCPECLHIADGAFWGIVIESQRHLKLLEPIVASLQGRADINAEEARDSNELVAQWYEKYEQSQKDLENAKAGFAQIRAWCSVAGLSGPVLTICEQQIKAIEERLDNEHRQIEL